MTRHNIAPRLSAILGAIALGAAGSAFAGEAQDFELPSMRTPIVQAATPAPVADSSAYTSEKLRSWYHDGQKSRDEVRAELKAARDAGTLSRGGEITDTPQVLRAREAYNKSQGDAIVAEYNAEHDRMVAEAEAEAALTAFALAPDESYADQTALSEPATEQPAPSTETAMSDTLPSDAQSSALFDTTAEPSVALSDSAPDSQLAQAGAETGIAPPYENDLNALAPSDAPAADNAGDQQVAAVQ